MCGIVGVIGEIGLLEKRYFDILLTVDIVRGRDATGTFKVHQDGSYQFIKSAGLPPELYFDDYLNDYSAEKEGKQYDAYFDRNTGYVHGNDLKFLIGHNRSATVGIKTDPAGAHPFDFENVIGVHNGTFQHQAYSKMEYYKESVSDTEALYYEINKNGLEATYEKHDGAMACVYYDKVADRLKIFRNGQRPLHVKWRKDKRTALIASEEWMLDWAVMRYPRHADNWETENLFFKVNQCYTVDFCEEKGVVWSLNALKPAPFSTTTTYGGCRGGGTVGSTETTQTTTQTKTKEKTIKSSFPRLANLDPSDIYYVPPKDITKYTYSENIFWWWDENIKMFRRSGQGYAMQRMSIPHGWFYTYIWNKATELPHRFYETSAFARENLPRVGDPTPMFEGIEGRASEAFRREVRLGIDGLPVCSGVSKYNSDWYSLPHELWHFVKESREVDPQTGNIRFTHRLTEYVPWSNHSSTSNVIGLPPPSKRENKKEFWGPNEELCDEEEVSEYLKQTNGCSCCGSYPSPEDYEGLVWSDNGSVNFVCPECHEEMPQELLLQFHQLAC